MVPDTRWVPLSELVEKLDEPACKKLDAFASSHQPAEGRKGSPEAPSEVEMCVVGHGWPWPDMAGHGRNIVVMCLWCEKWAVNGIIFKIGALFHQQVY